MTTSNNPFKTKSTQATKEKGARPAVQMYAPLLDNDVSVNMPTDEKNVPKDHTGKYVAPKNPQQDALKKKLDDLFENMQTIDRQISEVGNFYDYSLQESVIQTLLKRKNEYARSILQILPPRISYLTVQMGLYDAFLGESIDKVGAAVYNESGKYWRAGTSAANASVFLIILAALSGISVTYYGKKLKNEFPDITKGTALDASFALGKQSLTIQNVVDPISGTYVVNAVLAIALAIWIANTIKNYVGSSETSKVNTQTSHEAYYSEKRHLIERELTELKRLQDKYEAFLNLKSSTSSIFQLFNGNQNIQPVRNAEEKFYEESNININSENDPDNDLTINNHNNNHNNNNSVPNINENLADNNQNTPNDNNDDADRERKLTEVKPKALPNIAAADKDYPQATVQQIFDMGIQRTLLNAVNTLNIDKDVRVRPLLLQVLALYNVGEEYIPAHLGSIAKTIHAMFTHTTNTETLNQQVTIESCQAALVLLYAANKVWPRVDLPTMGRQLYLHSELYDKNDLLSYINLDDRIDTKKDIRELVGKIKANYKDIEEAPKKAAETTPVVSPTKKI